MLPWQAIAAERLPDSTLLWANFSRNCPEQTYTKNIVREFQISPSGTTAIHNKHGKVTVNTWGERKVKIEVSISVNALSQQEADRALGQINVNFLSTTAFVKAETVIGSISCQSLENYVINYQVWIPTDNNLEISNKYGDCEIGNLNGGFTAQVKYGDLKAGKIKLDAVLRSDFCKAYIVSTNNLSGTVNHGSLLVDDAQNIQIEAENNTSVFRRANNIHVKARFGYLEVGKAKHVVLNTKFNTTKVMAANSLALTACNSRTEVDNLLDQLVADLQNGALEVGSVHKNFDRVEIAAVNTVVNIACQNTDFCYEISGLNTACQVPESHSAKAGPNPNHATTAGPIIKPGPKPSTVPNGIFTRQGCVGETSAQGKFVAKMTNGSLTLK